MVSKLLPNCFRVIFVCIRVLRVFVRVRTVMKNLEKLWNLKIQISRPGKVMENVFLVKSFGKVMEIHPVFHQLSL